MKLNNLYTLTGIAGVVGSAGGSLLLALSAEFIPYSLILWFLGVLSFTVHFSLIKLKRTLHLEYAYHVINTVATYSYTHNAYWTLLYASLGLAVYAMTQYLYKNERFRHVLAKQALGQLPKAVGRAELVAISLSLLGACLMALKLVPLEYVFFCWMLAALGYISMSIMLGTYHVLWNGALYLVTDVIGVANHAPEVFGVIMMAFTVVMFFVVTFSIRINQRYYGKTIGV